ncbi:MAG: ABC transporter permease [Candidatus Bathyarchaeota archaeon]|nr:ABC transporter permease [Candidatus Termiticorpusculum sp.]
MGILSMSVRSLMRRKNRTIIAIITLTLALTLITILPPSINARQELTQNVLDNLIFSADFLKDQVTLSATEIECNYPITTTISTSKGSNLRGDGTLIDLVLQDMMNASLCDSIAALPDVVDVVPTRIDWNTESRLYHIYGVDVNNGVFQKNPTVLPANITAGRNLQAGDSGVVVIDEILAKQAFPYGDGKFETNEEYDAALAEWQTKDYVYNVGDFFEVLGHEFTIVGVEGGVLTSSTHGVTMCLEDAQAITGNTGRVSSLKVFVNDVDNVNSVVARIKSLDSDLVVSSGFTQLNTVSPLQNQVVSLTLVAQNNLNQVRGVGIAEIGVSVVAVVAVILFMMLYSVRERTKEIGTLKALGASTRRILGQFMLEGILLCVIASLIAIAVSTFVLPQLSSLILPIPVQEGLNVGFDANGALTLYRMSSGAMPFLPGEAPRVIGASLSVGWLVLCFVLSVVLGALGSLYPALKAARTKPSEAMKYE